MLKQFSSVVKITSLVAVLALSFGLSYTYAAWTAPTAPPPGANAYAPINTGPIAQNKIGNLTLGQTSLPTAPNSKSGNIAVNDVYIRSVGKWVSQLSSTAAISLPGPSIYLYTGKVQHYTVPAGTTKVFIKASGSEGRSVGNYTYLDGHTVTGGAGGKGGFASGYRAVTPGEILNVYVGAGTYNSGASDVRIGGTGLSNRVIVAGAGGDGGYGWHVNNDYYPDFYPGGGGGAGGGYNGGAGGGNGPYNSGGGGGGGQTAGGAGGYAGGPAGGFGYGGSGAGGGWYGGGGPAGGAGGGGGSSYLGGVTGGVTGSGQNIGQGQITITPY